MPKNGFSEIAKQNLMNPADIQSDQFIIKTHNSGPVTGDDIRSFTPIINHEIPSIRTNLIKHDISNIDITTTSSLDINLRKMPQTLIMENGKVPSPVYSNETTYKAHNNYVMNAHKPPIYAQNHNEKNNTVRMQTNPFAVSKTNTNNELPTKN